jgi:hypothetical protein
MTAKRPASARETYEAYMKGEITPAEAAKRAQDWYASRPASPKPPSKG